MRHRLIPGRSLRLAGLAAALSGAALVAACGGGGGGSSGGGGNPTPSQPGDSVPDAAMQSVGNFMRFMAAWAADDTVEPLLLADEPPPTDDGEAQPL